VRWMNGANGTDLTFEIEMNSPKLVFAEFELLKASASNEMTSAVFQSAGAEVNAQSVDTNKRIGRSGHFIDNEDGAIYDIRTGLIWKRTVEGETWRNNRCTGKPSLMSWKRAMELTTHGGWRIPSIKELGSLVDRDQKPMIDELVFPGQLDRIFWSSSTVFGGARRGDVFVFNFYHGSSDVSYPNAKAYVRLVRDRNGSSTTSNTDSVATQLFTLTCSREGNGDGAVNWNLESGKVESTPAGNQFREGSVVTLTAIPTEGSRFTCWRGDTSGTQLTCTLTFNSAKSVVAVFEALEVFSLTVTPSGDGQGSVERSPDTESYFDGSRVTLTATAAQGSLFCGWHGDAAGLDETCTVSMDAAKSVTAEFQCLAIAKLTTTVEFESTEHVSMKNGEPAIVFYLRIRNAGDKQVQIRLPRATYVNQRGEEVEQSVWLSGLLLGGDTAKIRAGTFRKVGLVFYKSTLSGLANGERLYVTVEQSKPPLRMSFVFRCKHYGAGAFELIQATSEVLAEPPDTKQLEQELSALRWEVAKLRIELATARLQLSMANDPADPADDDPLDEDDEDDDPVEAETDNAIKTVVTWLARQDRVTMAALRELLLPLDLLPNAVINELNELALDLTGEMALEESGDEILVSRSTLDEVLATAVWNQS